MVLLHDIMLAPSLKQHESAISIHRSSSSWATFPTATYIPPIHQGHYTEHQAELLLQSTFPLAIYFAYGDVDV